MCGVISFVGPAPVDPGRLEGALERLSVRGPDESGMWQSPGGLCALGHTRLAIVDPEAGQHPIRNENGTVVAVVNGEFYGYPLIRAQLESQGHRFQSHSDSEILVHLYEEYGLEAIHHLRGEFAFLLWDENRQLLWAARDRFGIKPLVYARIGENWWFASKARALFAAGLKPRWDEECFYHACSTQYAPTDDTLFLGVCQIPPGHQATVSARDLPHLLLTRPYWDIPRHRPDESLTVDDFGEALDSAVRLRLPRQKCAFHLSGGLDSASVVALACQTLEEVDVFTIGFAHPDYDELELAEQVADRYGATLHRIALSPQDLLSNLEPAVEQTEGLAVNCHLSGKYLLSQAIQRQGFKVVLTGEGSDEVLLGYPHFRQDLKGGLLDPQLLSDNQASAGIMLSQGPTLDLSALHDELGWTPQFMRAKAALGYRLHSVMRRDFLEAFRGRDCFLEMLADQDLEDRGRLDQASYLWCKSALCNYILQTLGDGCEMAHSLEGRLPFLDHHLVELVARYPLNWKIRGGEEKWLLREAMRPLLPRGIIERRKHPFVAPPLSLESTALTNALVEAVRHGCLPFLDPSKLQAQLQRVAQLPPAERHEWDPVWTWLLTAHYLQSRLGLR